MVDSKFGEHGDALIEAANALELGSLQLRFTRFVKAHQGVEEGQRSGL